MESDRILAFIAEEEREAVLATIVGVEGHAYRKTGASMLFYGKEGAGRIGSISPGCLESDLALRCGRVWETGEPEVVEYDMRDGDDFGWGEAIGCGGRIDVLLEPVSGPLRELLLEAAKRVARGERTTLLRHRGEERPRYELAAGEAAADGGAFAVVFAPRPRLVLFGAGLDAAPIASLARLAGFRVVVVDWRENAAVPERFPGADVFVGSPEEAAERLAVGPGDYAVVCSHQFTRDQRFIDAMLRARPQYLGVVGSKSRIRALFDGREPPSFVRAPIGLAIGAEGPEEIAIAIAAELVWAKRRGAEAPNEGGERHEGGRHLFGGGLEPTDGAAEAAAGVVRG
ncbi:XdhC family protein [Paenibacillus sp.]|uniref:XdhC family protein n=1 Tax=Paenibacillus sp. TaxID=58172 RepID=UPI002D6357A2|nr:XdhC family protein [Paenibacillus sp.]HZG83973.1 XdhC family protein [Paenibacillus sp.]